MFESKNICFKNISFKLTNQFVYILIYMCFSSIFLINVTNGAPKSSCSAVNTVFTTRGFTPSDIVVDPIHGKCFLLIFIFLPYYFIFLRLYFILKVKSSLLTSTYKFYSTMWRNIYTKKNNIKHPVMYSGYS